LTVGRVLFDEAAIAQRVADLAAEIAAAMPAELLAIGVLKGGFIFLADLVRALDRRGARPEVEFMRLSSYGRSRESSGSVRLLGEPPVPLVGREVLLVDDIADTGVSLEYARSFLLQRGARRVLTCVLLDKPSRRKVPFVPDFVGFVVGDEFVVGYGLDDGERYRHLPYLAVAEANNDEA
jgi:hypoxanthine phosphoribosyltransferase